MYTDLRLYETIVRESKCVMCNGTGNRLISIHGQVVEIQCECCGGAGKTSSYMLRRIDG